MKKSQYIIPPWGITPLDVLAGISYDPPLTDPFLLKNNWKIAYRIHGKRVKDFFKVPLV